MSTTKSTQLRITNTLVDSLRRTKKMQFIRDTVQPGFQIKVHPTGHTIYQVEARLGGTGKVKKFKLGSVSDMPLAEARERAREALSKIRSGIDPLQEKRALVHEGKSLGNLITLYMDTRPLKPRTQKDYEYIREKHLKQWLDRRVSDITRHEIRDWYALGRTAPTQTEGAYRFLNSLMVFAMGLEIINENPCQIVTQARMRYRIKAKTSHLEVNDDLPKFLTALTQYQYLRDSERVARDLTILILTTGLRSTEARTLKWENVDFRRKQFTIPDPKNRRPHTVPMVPLTYSLLRYREENAEGSEYVFRIKRTTKSGHVTDIQKTLTNICEAAEVPIVTPHDLRRTFATVLNSMDVGYADLKQLMNHKARDITAGVYIQPDIEKLRKTLYGVVSYYDHKIPHFAPRQGCSQYGEGTLRFVIYNKGDVTPTELSNPTDEDPEWIAWNERELWEG